jgi:hypothetical protein
MQVTSPSSLSDARENSAADNDMQWGFPRQGFLETIDLLDKDSFAVLDLGCLDIVPNILA